MTNYFLSVQVSADSRALRYTSTSTQTPQAPYTLNPKAYTLKSSFLSPPELVLAVSAPERKEGDRWSPSCALCLALLPACSMARSHRQAVHDKASDRLAKGDWQSYQQH